VTHDALLRWRLVPGVLTLVVGVVVLAGALPGAVAGFWWQLQARPLALLYAGRPLSERDRVALATAQELALAARPAGAHHAALAAATLRRIEQERPRDPAGHPLFPRAVRLTEEGLARAPADPRGWLQLAWLRTVADGPGEPAARALAMSLRTGATEASAILSARLRLLIANREHLDAATLAAIPDQIRRLWHGAPAEVVALAAHPAARRLVARALATEPGAVEALHGMAPQGS
jgi:hypothetical protein